MISAVATLDTMPLEVTRRDVLRRSAGTAGSLGLGSVLVGDGERLISNPCPDVTLGPSMDHYGDHGMGGCDDDHPETQAIKEDVAEALETNYPTVGALIDDGFIPYFDFLTGDDKSGWSHWLNPRYLSDDDVLNPQRPESVLVDHRWWRPIGVMFFATRDGDRVDPPPAVYGDDDSETEPCRPWHAHTGSPGVSSWWKYKMAYTNPSLTEILNASCRTPWGMHVWAYPHPKSVYAHSAPPPENRGGPPAEDPGFETDAVPGEDPLSPEVLPDVLKRRVRHL